MEYFKKPELLAPAGDLEKLKTAIIYGADAVYIGGERFGLRAKARNFTMGQMKEGIEFAHKFGKKVYITVNIFAHNSDIDGFSEYVCELNEMGVDAFIVSDPGLFGIVKEAAPRAEIHISTQANITNYKSANFWYDLGARRVVLARELSFDEIAEIRRNTNEDLVIECFVHGAMCLSYSGRCYLSQYMTGRDANKGSCTQPCRFGYYLMEEKRQDEFYKIYEDERGTYILNSKDMRMIEHIPELLRAGIGSFKIEGRMKTAYYAASTVKAYRMAIDDYFDNPKKYSLNIAKYIEETEKSSHRNYYTGFYFDDNKNSESNGQFSGDSSYIRNYDYVGIVLGYDDKTGIATVAQRNKFSVGDELEVLRQNDEGFSFEVTEMYDEKGDAIESAPHSEQILKIKTPEKVQEYNMLRHARC